LLDAGSSGRPEIRGMVGVMTFVVLINGMVALVGFFLSFLMFRYSSAIGRFLHHRDQESLALALRAQRWFWVYWIIMWGGSMALGCLFALVAAMLMPVMSRM
ncbi:MAG: hypothetical protein N2C14_14675, partial [Planctomycetales bacterium]